MILPRGYGGGISIAEGYRLRPDLLTREELRRQAENLVAKYGGT